MRLPRAHQRWGKAFRAKTAALGPTNEQSLKLSDEVKRVTFDKTRRIYECLSKAGVDSAIVRRLGAGELHFNCQQRAPTTSALSQLA